MSQACLSSVIAQYASVQVDVWSHPRWFDKQLNLFFYRVYIYFPSQPYGYVSSVALTPRQRTLSSVFLFDDIQHILESLFIERMVSHSMLFLISILRDDSTNNRQLGLRGYYNCSKISNAGLSIRRKAVIVEFRFNFFSTNKNLWPSAAKLRST